MIHKLSWTEDNHGRKQERFMRHVSEHGHLEQTNPKEHRKEVPEDVFLEI